MKVRLPATPTPATASFPSRPTQYRSTRKYSVWKTIVTSMKLAVLIKCAEMGPLVRSCITVVDPARKGDCPLFTEFARYRRKCCNVANQYTGGRRRRFIPVDGQRPQPSERSSHYH